MKAAVFFPGIGYHCDKPLLYYSRKLSQECGYEQTIALIYTYENANHSLETTDTLENMKILQDVMEKTKGFLEQK